MDKRTVLREAIKIIRRYLGEEYRLYLFGSWAKGEARETSDFDIGILGETEVSWSIMTKINSEIRGIQTLRKIDVVDLNATSERFRNSALRSAKELTGKTPSLSIGN